MKYSQKKKKHTQLFVYKRQTYWRQVTNLCCFSFLFYNRDLYATLSLCPEVTINMTVMYQMQKKPVWLYCCYSVAYHSVHVLCVSEINRVRKDMYSDTVNGLVDRHPLELPEPIGPIVHLQEKLFVPVKEYPDVSTCITVPIILVHVP